MLRSKIIEFVERGDFGLASGLRNGGTYERLWFAEPLAAEEIVFEAGVYLLKKATAERLRQIQRGAPAPSLPDAPPTGESGKPEISLDDPVDGNSTGDRAILITVVGSVPPEHWNRLGTRLIPKLRSNSSDGKGVTLEVRFSTVLRAGMGSALVHDVEQTLADLGLDHVLRIETKEH